MEIVKPVAGSNSAVRGILIYWPAARRMAFKPKPGTRSAPLTNVPWLNGVPTESRTPGVPVEGVPVDSSRTQAAAGIWGVAERTAVGAGAGYCAAAGVKLCVQRAMPLDTRSS